MDLVTTTQSSFEKIKRIDENNEEYWLARELMPALEYDTWEGFHKVINRAKKSMAKIYPQVELHFRQVSKLSKTARGKINEGNRSIVDYKLTRYACYLIAQNGDSVRKTKIAEAQSYFAYQTRLQELEEEKQKAIERVIARDKLKLTEKKFSGVLFEKGLNKFDVAEIRSSGDEALFDMSTRDIKDRLGLSNDRALADVLPTVTIKAKDLATEITTFNTLQKNLARKSTIKQEHKSNNTAVRKLLNDKGIYPEELAPEVDIQKLLRRIPLELILQKKTNEFLDQDLIIDIIEVEDRETLLRIKNIIEDNKGSTTLKVIYGNHDNPKMLIKKISISTDLIEGLKKYIVLSE